MTNEKFLVQGSGDCLHIFIPQSAIRNPHSFASNNQLPLLFLFCHSLQDLAQHLVGFDPFRFGFEVQDDPMS